MDESGHCETRSADGDRPEQVSVCPGREGLRDLLQLSPVSTSVSISRLRCILFSNTSYLPVPSPVFSLVFLQASYLSILLPLHSLSLRTRPNPPSLALPPNVHRRSDVHLCFLSFCLVSQKPNEFIVGSLRLTVNSGYLGTLTGNEGVLA